MLISIKFFDFEYCCSLSNLLCLHEILFFRLGKDDSTARATVIRATTDSPMSPPPVATTAVKLQRGLYSQRSLLDIWLQRSAPKDKAPEFAGRLNCEGLKAKLYPNLKEAGREPREAMIEG